MCYYEFDKTVDDDFPWIVYDGDGVEQISCDCEDDAQGYVDMFNSNRAKG